MSTNIDDFKARLTGGGARPNLFKVVCNFPGGGPTELASFMIKGASLPASNIAPIEVPFRGRKLKIAGDRTFEPWTITVINDNNMAIRRAFESWMGGINAHAANSGATTPGAYMADMEVQQLDRTGGIIATYYFRGAFPTAVSAIDLNFETNDAVEDFTVELSYQYWEVGGSSSGGVSAGISINSSGVAGSVTLSKGFGGITIGGGKSF